MTETEEATVSEITYDEVVKSYIRTLPWSDDATEEEKTLVTANIRDFASFYREAIGQQSNEQHIPVRVYCSMAMRDIHDYTRHLINSLAAIIDAAIPEPRHNRAVHALVDNMVWTEHYGAVQVWCKNAAGQITVTADDSTNHRLHAFPFAD